MEMIVKFIVNLVGFSIIMVGLSSIESLYYSIKSIIKKYPNNELKKRMVSDTLLITLGVALTLYILRWKLPEIMAVDLHQNNLPFNQHIIALIGSSTIDIHSILFYPALMGFIYNLKEVQYGEIPSKLFVRNDLLPIIAASILCTFVPSLVKVLLKN